MTVLASTDPLECADRAHFDACAFASWFSNPRLAAVSIHSHVLPLKKVFVDYLLSDGVFLPASGFASQAIAFPSGESDDEEGYDDDEDEDRNSSQIPAETLAYLDSVVVPFIRDAVGASPSSAVFPKLSWSAPRDASWVGTGNVSRCVEPNDVLLLLKSSDFVVHDLTHPYEGCYSESERSPEVLPAGGYHLVLRDWVDNMLPSMEFRVFVRDSIVVGICQRDHSNRYKFLEGVRAQVVDIVMLFFEDVMKTGGFAEPNYVFDVYIKADVQVDPDTRELVVGGLDASDADLVSKVVLVDINPFAPTTDALLFTWEEICTLGPKDTGSSNDTAQTYIPPIRISMVQSEHTEYSFNRVPKDFVNVTDADAINDFIDKFKRGKYDEIVGESDSDEDSDS